MLTVDDIRTIPLLSDVPAAELGLLAQRAADIRLGPGEYAVHEGDERALFAVLAGRIEVTKRHHGIERTIGWRAPGQVFGEVPMALGGPFLGSYRAAEPSRVMRLEAREYYTVAAAAPAVSAAVGALARERIGGLAGIAAEAPQAQVTVVGHRWDQACHDLRRFLSRNQVTYDWLTPDAPELPRKWPAPLPAEGECPALRLADGSVLVRPGAREAARRLGLQTSARLPEHDTVVIGGGPAGLAAAVYGASEGLRTLVVEREAPGGQAGTSSRIENYLGFTNGISGDELASRAPRSPATPAAMC